MSDKASEHCANEFDTYWLLSPQREEQRPTFRRFYLTGYEKGREAAKSELRDELKAAFEAGRLTVEYSQQSGGYSFNHHTGNRWENFAAWYDQHLKERG